MAITISNPIQHKDFTYDDEKVEIVARDIEVVNKHKAKLGKFFSPSAEINGDQLIQRRQVLLDPDSVADLNEGDTPRQDTIKVLTFSKSLRSFGSYILHTRHALKRNRDNVLDMERRQLVHARLFDVESTRFLAMNTTPYSAEATYASSKFNWWDTLTNLAIRLEKNNGAGEKIFMCTPEIRRDIAREMKEANSLLVGTPEGVKIYGEGYAGEYAGFHIIANQEKYMYENRTVSGTTTRYQNAFAFCKDENGKWPMVDTGMGTDKISGEVIVKALGDLGNDPTNEIGSIASRIDYVGAYVDHPELVFKITNVTTGSGGRLAEVGSDLPDAYKIEANAQTNVGAGRDNATWQEVIPGGAQFALSINVVKAADGDAISSPTVVVKVGSSSGSTVSADSDGNYPVIPGKKYYYSVSKTSYTTKTGTLLADPTKKVFTVALAAA